MVRLQAKSPRRAGAGRVSLRPLQFRLPRESTARLPRVRHRRRDPRSRRIDLRPVRGESQRQSGPAALARSRAAAEPRVRNAHRRASQRSRRRLRSRARQRRARLLLREALHPNRLEQDGAAQPPGEGPGALDARSRLVGGGVQGRFAGRPRPGSRPGGPRAVHRETSRSGRRRGELGRPDLSQQGARIEAGRRHARRGRTARPARISVPVVAGRCQGLVDPQRRGEPRARVRTLRAALPARRRSPAEADPHPDRSNAPSGTLFRRRSANTIRGSFARLHNAIAHQDYRRHGRISRRIS